MSKIDTKYCYLSDSIGMKFNPELYNSKENTIGCHTYKDPDAVSKKLYDDLKNLWNSEILARTLTDQLPLKFEKHATMMNLVDQYGRRYSSDFIGPSRAWAKYVLIEDFLIGKYLEKARTIGGHMIWPLNGTSRTINTARGGGNSLYDRIDLTLAELRNYFVGDSFWFIKGLRTVFEKEETWLSNFRNISKDGLFAFTTFIDYWKLNPFVSGSDYQVISLAKSDLKNNEILLVTKNETIFPGNNIHLRNKDIMKLDEFKDKHYANQLKNAYSKYIENNLYAIEERNALYHRMAKENTVKM